MLVQASTTTTGTTATAAAATNAPLTLNKEFMMARLAGQEAEKIQCNRLPWVLYQGHDGHTIPSHLVPWDSSCTTYHGTYGQVA
jgi:hypothetical protein